MAESFRSWQIGDVRVTRVVEDVDDEIMAMVLPQATPDALATIPWLRPHFVGEDGRGVLSIHALVVETPQRRVLVDTCLGNGKERLLPRWHMRSSDFLADLARAGYETNTIDTVLCTHLHVDHVGWNTRWDEAAGRWVPTFPNARYLIARDEWTHWESAPDADAIGPVLGDSVRPVFEAGLVDLVATDHRVCEEIRLVPTPGHTPGHVSVWIESGGARAVITGDMIHHPCQIARTDWSSPVDTDGRRSAATRLELLETCADAPILMIGTHFHEPTAGHIVRESDAYRLDTARSMAKQGRGDTR
jgi:glyoxylase-like metal-dependent hydrolase (beta-lactamase superfamily II)